MAKRNEENLERKDPRKAVQSIKDAAEKIKNGASVLIFPEGTRGIDGRLQPYKKGGFNLALRSGCDIVPVTIGIRIFFFNYITSPIGLRNLIILVVEMSVAM